jgi:hypothetical protein
LANDGLYPEDKDGDKLSAMVMQAARDVISDPGTLRDFRVTLLSLKKDQ